jgi:Rho guanine nucleotide exchange factor 17
VFQFSRQSVVDCYTAFINNWQQAKSAISNASQSKPAFARFLEATSREHKGKLALDSLLIMPVQRIPRYEMLIQVHIL